jgi:hypothetical protein
LVFNLPLKGVLSNVITKKNAFFPDSAEGKIKLPLFTYAEAAEYIIEYVGIGVLAGDRSKSGDGRSDF